MLASSIGFSGVDDGNAIIFNIDPRTVTSVSGSIPQAEVDKATYHEGDVSPNSSLVSALNPPFSGCPAEAKTSHSK